MIFLLPSFVVSEREIITQSRRIALVIGNSAYEKAPLSEVVLFGYYANGNITEHSDIDFAIISDSFLYQSHLKNMHFLSKNAANYNSLFEAIPFKQQEYKNLYKRSFLAGILKSGRRIPLD